VRVEEGAFSHVLLPTLLRRSGLEPRDRAFATDLVYGTLREQRALDHLLTPVVSRPLASLDPPVRAALRIGAHQLLGGTPAHAAVGETVEVAPERARGLVNAALRRLSREGPPWPLPDGDAVADVAVRLSYPDWLVERLAADLGPDDALATLESANVPAPVTLRPNRARIHSSALADELHDGGATVEPGALGIGAVVVRGIGDPARVPAVADGRASPQDEASQAVVRDVLAPQPGDRVLDTAAAPGGKATAIAELVGEDGTVVALDVNRGRLGFVVGAAARLGLANLHAVQADGRCLPAKPGAFNRVLVDAPCSGLGVLRRRPELRWRVEPDAIGALAELQRELLTAAATAVAPGGTLVYSVCTLTTEETRGVDEWARTGLGEFDAAVPPPPPWRPWGRGALLLPHDAATDGMFVLRLIRRNPAAHQ